jgi:hypothetical protein
MLGKETSVGVARPTIPSRLFVQGNREIVIVEMGRKVYRGRQLSFPPPFNIHSREH